MNAFLTFNPKTSCPVLVITVYLTCLFTLFKIIPDTVTERLYQAMLPNLPQYMIALLKILLAAAPTAKPKNDSINILSDILPKDMP